MACATGATAQTASRIAGLHPDRRPDDAPRVPEAARTPAQVEQTLYGVEKPIPGNVELIAATGNWWVPLRQPGMNAPYDLRGWHSAAPSDTPSTAMPLAR
ncbi:MAG: hypothetical protein FWG56_10655 [Desulfovibrionaceae bacterium]|nr:hypothetical protein [Desulfovibrionaceae bacterium]